jgi:hypothetical protein
MGGCRRGVVQQFLYTSISRRSALEQACRHGGWGALAEADGNRTRQAEMLGFIGFEDREGHQAPIHLRGGA